MLFKYIHIDQPKNDTFYIGYPVLTLIPDGKQKHQLLFSGASI